MATPALSPHLSALASTILDPGATITPELAATVLSARRGPSPFASRAPALPPLAVALPGASRIADVDLRVTGVLAEGGMGRVYVAEQRTLAREVAIKAVKDPSALAQTDALVWEGMIMGYLDHPGVTPVHLLGAAQDGSPLLVMKRIVGLSWSELLKLPEPWARVSTLPRDRLRAHLEILMEVARTLHHAHQRGVAHLDLKPDNVMIGELGEVYLVDWGIATTLERAAESKGGFAGTPSFVAPEVVAGEAVGVWTDVYLLGAALYFVLTGRARHEGATLTEVLERALVSEPVVFDAGAPTELTALVNAATDRDPSKRPRDALAFRAAIVEYLGHAASLALAQDGEARLVELEQVLPQRGAEASARALRLVTEARFAFRAALEGWPENPEAQRGLARVHEATAEIEILRENVIGAREAVAELAAVPEALAARLAELEEKIRRRVASEAELKRVEKEQDLSAGARSRFAGIVTVGLFVIVATIFGGGLTPVDPARFKEASTKEALALPVLFTTIVGVCVIIFRRTTLANTIGRRLVGAFLSISIGLGLHRVILTLLPAPALAGVVGDLFVVAAVIVGVALFVVPRAWGSVAILVAGAASLALFPLYATLVFNVSSVLATSVVLWALQAAADAKPASSEAGRSIKNKTL